MSMYLYAPFSNIKEIEEMVSLISVIMHRTPLFCMVMICCELFFLLAYDSILIPGFILKRGDPLLCTITYIV